MRCHHIMLIEFLVSLYIAYIAAMYSCLAAQHDDYRQRDYYDYRTNVAARWPPVARLRRAGAARPGLGGATWRGR